ncbi:TonB-dependent receptor [Roseateles koreensis]|uniref:TonB-dependent receptor n=1 Tax=Roseateles koreensis TaxID=2987526 RepID=A0ABT5KV41_9BURK|nr:TonB-dependent receptor [Roseateles koreensis]MDC8786810.1 TonB-dependent receptor [Roseateles koreensis]
MSYSPPISRSCRSPSQISLAAALICSSFLAHAQERPAKEDDKPQQLAMANVLETVEVSGRHYDNAVGSSDAASQGVVRAELLKSRPLLRPGEVLETVPGLVVTQHSGDGKANQYFLRGFNLDHGTDFATTVDGLPVNMPSHGHGQGYSDLNFLMPELVDRIEYRKGPYFAGNGDFAAAGSADMLLQRRLRAPFVQLTLGGGGYRRGLLAGSSDLNAGLHLLGAVEVMRNDGPWTLKEGLHRNNAVLSLSKGNAQAGWSASLMAYDARWNSTDQVPQRLVQAGRYDGKPFGRFDAVDPTDGGETSRSSLSFEWHDADAHGSTHWAAYALDYRLKLFSNFTYAMDRPGMGDQFSQQDQRHVYGLSAKRVIQHKLGGFEASSELGLQLRHDNIRVGLYDSQARVLSATTRDDEVRQSLASVYAQTGVEWSPKFRSVLGLRLDRLDARVNSLLQPLNSGTAGQTLLSPKLSLVMGPWNKTEFFFNAGSGFHSNDARGMTAAVDPKSGEAQERVPGLVRARGAEIGTRTEWLPGLQSSLSLWQLNFDSELIYSGDSGTTSAQGPSRRYGVEWNNHWLPTPGLQIDLDMAWTHARFKFDASDDITVGRYIPNSVDQVVTGTVTLNDLGPWSMSLTERYIGSGPLSADNSVRSESSLISNLRLGRSLGPKMQLNLDVLNLFDRRYNDIEYFYATQLKGEPAPVNGKVIHPGEPRTLRLTLKAQF